MSQPASRRVCFVGEDFVTSCVSRGKPRLHRIGVREGVLLSSEHPVRARVRRAVVVHHRWASRFSKHPPMGALDTAEVISTLSRVRTHAKRAEAIREAQRACAAEEQISAQ